MWPFLTKAATKAGLDQFVIHTGICSNSVDIFLSTQPRVWFLAAPMHTVLDDRWRTLWVAGGWAEDPLTNEICEELVLNIKKLASSSNCTKVLYNDSAPFLVNLLTAAGEPIWQQAKW